MSGLHLWGRISSLNVRKVVLTAQVLGIALARSDAGREYGVVNTPEYLAQNPNALVPLLQHGDFSLWESNVIVRYLCALHAPGALYPLDLRQRFEAERWMDWQQAEFNRASGPPFMQWFRTAPDQRDHTLIARSTAATEKLLALLDTRLATRDYLAGDTLTMADIPMACEIHRWWGLPQPRPAYPHIERWYARWLAHRASHGVLDLPLS